MTALALGAVQRVRALLETHATDPGLALVLALEGVGGAVVARVRAQRPERPEDHERVEHYTLYR